MANVIDSTGKVVRDVATPAVLDKDYTQKAHTIFRAVYRELANPRAGTASTKKRDEVSGGGRKPFAKLIIIGNPNIMVAFHTIGRRGLTF